MQIVLTFSHALALTPYNLTLIPDNLYREIWLALLICIAFLPFEIRNLSLKSFGPIPESHLRG